MGEPIDIWRIAPEGIVDELEAIDARLGMLAAGERERATAIRDRDDARFWAASRIAMRLLIASHCGPSFARAEIVADPSGRPRLAGSDIEISVSHSRPLALVAISPSPVGVDVEAHRQVRLSASRRSAIEASAIEVADGTRLPGAGDARFIAAWCRLEALAKATGLGVARTLTRLGARGHGGASTERAGTSAWAVRDIEVGPGFAAALAAPSPLPSYVLHRFPEDRDTLDAWLARRPSP